MVDWFQPITLMVAQQAGKPIESAPKQTGLGPRSKVCKHWQRAIERSVTTDIDNESTAPDGHSSVCNIV